MGADVEAVAAGKRLTGRVVLEGLMNVNDRGDLGSSGRGDLSARKRTIGDTSVDSGCYLD